MGNDWYKSHLERFRHYRNAELKNRRDALITLLGGECRACGFPFKNNPQGISVDLGLDCLHIDHVNGGGVRDRRIRHNRLNAYGAMIIEIIDGSKEYQLLCPTCNWIKKIINEER
jgi:hypothetical protein